MVVLPCGARSMPQARTRACITALLDIQAFAPGDARLKAFEQRVTRKHAITRANCAAGRMSTGSSR